MSYTAVFKVKEGDFLDVIAFGTHDEAYEYGVQRSFGNDKYDGFRVVHIQNPVSHVLFRKYVYEIMNVRETPEYQLLTSNLHESVMTTVDDKVFQITILINRDLINFEVNMDRDFPFDNTHRAFFQFVSDYCLYIGASKKFQQFLEEVRTSGLSDGDMPC